jgi:hypothetical protein
MATVSFLLAEPLGRTINRKVDMGSNQFRMRGRSGMIGSRPFRVLNSAPSAACMNLTGQPMVLSSRLRYVSLGHLGVALARLGCIWPPTKALWPMFRKAFAAATALLFFIQTTVATFPAYAQPVSDRQHEPTNQRLAGVLLEKMALLDVRDRRVSLAGLDVFLRDDYSGPLPVAVRATCLDRSTTPSLAIDATTHGPDARLLNVTRAPEYGCTSYQVSAALVQLAQAAVGTPNLDAVLSGIAVSVHYSGPTSADAQTKDPAVFVFNPVHGNWTEAKPFAPAVQEPQRVYATLSEQHQRIIGGVIVLPDPLHSEPTKNGPTALAKPLEQVSPTNGYLAIDRIEPDSKGSHTVDLPMLLRPSRGPGPSFSIRYNSQGAPGVLGRGWDLFISSIEVRGPASVYHPSYETEDYLLDGMDLIALDAQGKDIPALYKGGPILPRVGGLRFFRLRNNSGGQIVRRYGDAPGNYFWEVWDPNSHVTRLYGGKFVANAPPQFDGGNGALLSSVPFSDGVRRPAIGQWGLTQEYDRQLARNGAKYTYLQADPNKRECQEFAIAQLRCGSIRSTTTSLLALRRFLAPGRHALSSRGARVHQSDSTATGGWASSARTSIG